MYAPGRPEVQGARILHEGDRAALVALLDDDPFVNVVLASRVRNSRLLDARSLGGPVIGTHDASGDLIGAVHVSGALAPAGTDPRAWVACAARLTAQPAACSSIVGRADVVDQLWQRLAPSWRRPRAVRADQPLLVLESTRGLPAGDPRVRRVRPDEVEAYLPAAVAMFTEELDASPFSGGVGPYRRRIQALLDAGRGLGIVEPGGVVFKADIGAVSADTCQVQGVWVRPDRRGQGLGRAAMASVLRHALTLAPTVSLYVNDYNLPARRVYDRLGMRQVGTLSTVLF